MGFRGLCSKIQNKAARLKNVRDGRVGMGSVRR
jgi:hypothetical protein